MNIERVDKVDGIGPVIGAYSQSIVVPLGNSKIIFLTGQIALGENGEVCFPNNTEKQAELIFKNIGKLLRESGAAYDDIVKAQIFLTDIDDMGKVSEIRNRYFEKCRPATTTVEVSSLVKKECCIEIEVTAIKR